MLIHRTYLYGEKEEIESKFKSELIKILEPLKKEYKQTLKDSDLKDLGLM